MQAKRKKWKRKGGGKKKKRKEKYRGALPLQVRFRSVGCALHGVLDALERFHLRQPPQDKKGVVRILNVRDRCGTKRVQTPALVHNGGANLEKREKE